MLKKIILALLAFCAIAILGMALFSYQVIEELPLEELRETRPTVSVEKEKLDQIDEGARVIKEDLAAYWTWNQSDVGFEDEIKFKENAKKIEIKKEFIYPQEDLYLSSLEANHCELVYCMQHRMLFHEIPSLLWRGLIGIEDYRFLEHKGVDPRSLMRAIWHDIKVLKLEQGGSTLTQQLVKNLFYTSEKKFSRKIKEMVVSTYLEFKLDKEQILQMYFNEVMWGSVQGIKLKGIAAAAMGYFNKKPIELTPFEVSILISLLKGPYFYSPITHIDRLKERVQVVYQKLKELRLFPESGAIWNDKKWKQWEEDIKTRNERVHLRSLYYLTRSSNQKKFKNYILIKEIEELRKKLRKDFPKKDIAVKTLLFQVDKNKIERKFEHYTKYERSWEEALNKERHQVGSTLKPILYWLLVKNGLNLEDEVETGPLTLDLKSGSWSPREAHKEEREYITYREALVRSFNRPVVRAAQNYGWEKLEGELRPIIPQLLTPLAEYPAQLLGSIEMSLDELGNLYGTFLKSSCYEGVGPSVIEALSDPKVTTIRYRVGENLGQMKFFGKTGTTNQGNDNWFIGYDGKELLMNWVGIESGRDHGEKLNLYGSNSAFLIFKDYYMNRGKLFNEMVCR